MEALINTHSGLYMPGQAERLHRTSSFAISSLLLDLSMMPAVSSYVNPTDNGGGPLPSVFASIHLDAYTCSVKLASPAHGFNR